MDQKELIERLNAIVERFYPLPQGTLLTSGGTPFDITKPVIHDSKKEFSREKKTVEKAIKAAHVLRKVVTDQVDDEHPKTKEMGSRLCSSIDLGAFNGMSRQRPDTLPEFMRKSATEQGLSFMTFQLVTDFLIQLNKRKQELDLQEVTFWSAAHRPPNHFARIIALRFAQSIYRNTGDIPTFGTASDGNHPSTDYGRALEEIFELLGIISHVRNPATWALDQMKSGVALPTKNALANLFPQGPPEPSLTSTQLVARALMGQNKGPEE